MFEKLCLFIILSLNPCLANRTNGCASTVEPDCLKCGRKGCVRCPNLIIFPTRRCVHECPYGHVMRWSTMADYAGRICVANTNLFGLNTTSASVVLGILIGTLTSILLIICLIFYVRRKSTWQSSDLRSECDDDFLRQLDELRPHAPFYLDMLNDTRRQVRELRRDGDADALPAYRPVLRDLARVLLLLNRRTPPPDDWEHLFEWARKILKRCRRPSAGSATTGTGPTIGHLVDFLQNAVPARPDAAADEAVRTRTLSTFKPDASSMERLSATLNPQWRFDYAPVANDVPACEFDARIWRGHNGSSMCLDDDDFGQLGFRPQDEITTEL